MPEEATTQEVQTDPVPAGTGNDAIDAPGNTNVWLVLLFAAIVVLVSIQNMWLRRRAAREAQPEDEAS